MDDEEYLLEKLKWRMIEWEQGCPERIHHFLKVHSFAVTIAKGECLDRHTCFLLEALGYIHDIGIRISEEKEGRCDGKSQEKYGKPAAMSMLAACGFSENDARRISTAVGQHHTYDVDDQGMDYRILLEADACVNMYEKNTSDQAKIAMLSNVFRTTTGRKLYKIMFGLDMD